MAISFPVQIFVMAPVVGLLFSTDFTHAVDRSNFKTCAESGFCSRLRNLQRDRSSYRLALDKLKIRNDSTVEIPVFKTSNAIENSAASGLYTMIISGLRDKSMRLQIVDPIIPRYQFNDSFPYGFQHQAIAVKHPSVDETVIATEDGLKLILYGKLMQIDAYVDDRLIVSLNSRHMFEFERTKVTPPRG